MKGKLNLRLGLAYLLLCVSLSAAAQNSDVGETLSLEQAVRVSLQNNSLLKASELGVDEEKAPMDRHLGLSAKA